MMDNQIVLKKYIKYLLNSAKKRNSNQGVIVYEKILDELNYDLSEDKLDQCLNMLIRALNGIEAHGFLTSDEFKIVKSIRQMNVNAS